REDLLTALGQAAALCPFVEASLKSPTPAGFGVDVQGAHRFLAEHAWLLEAAGFTVFLPAWWTRKGGKHRLGVAAEVKSPPRATSSAGGLSLRPYQVRGYSWLAFLRQWGLGACLADDMGLGKTIQTLALLQRDWPAHHRPTLLICPTSVVANWKKEADRFTPELPVMIHHGAQ